MFKRNLRQWKMRITAYADRLIDDLERVDWPESGQAHAAQLDRPVARRRRQLSRWRAQTSRSTCSRRVPTPCSARPTWSSRPEAELVDQIVASAWPADVDPRWTGGAATPAEAVAAYRAQAAAKTDLERQENRDKTGVFTGAYAVNPVNDEQIPVFIADYVLAGYGTGAIMAVPGSGRPRLGVRRDVRAPDRPHGAAARGRDEGPYLGEGPAINSS